MFSSLCSLEMSDQVCCWGWHYMKEQDTTRRGVDTVQIALFDPNLGNIIVRSSLILLPRLKPNKITAQSIKHVLRQRNSYYSISLLGLTPLPLSLYVSTLTVSLKLTCLQKSEFNSFDVSNIYAKGAGFFEVPLAMRLLPLKVLHLSGRRQQNDFKNSWFHYSRNIHRYSLFNLILNVLSCICVD